MNRRWIIRSFFIGLLLLFVGGWIGTYSSNTAGFRYVPRSTVSGYFISWRVHCLRGEIRLLRYEHFIQIEPEGWSFYHDETESRNFVLRRYFGQFHFGFYVGAWQAAIPFWFPTTLSAALLLWVWLMTRPKVMGRAFPVELAKRTTEQTSKAE